MEFEALSGLIRWMDRFGESLALVLACVGVILLVSFLVTVMAWREEPRGFVFFVKLLEWTLYVACLTLIADLVAAAIYNFGLVGAFDGDIPAWAEGLSLILYLGLIASVVVVTGVLMIAAILSLMQSVDDRPLLVRFSQSVERVLFQTAGVLLLLVLAGVFYNTVARYFFNSPEQWSEAAPRVFYLWMTYLAVAVATKRGENIRVTFIFDRLDPLRRLLLEVFMHVLVMSMLSIVIWHNFPLLRLGLRGTMLATQWSNVVTFLPLTVGGLFILFYQALLVPKAFAAYRASGAPRLRDRRKAVFLHLFGALVVFFVLQQTLVWANNHYDLALLAFLVIMLLFFSLVGMEIAWAIAFAGFGYLVLTQFGFTPRAEPFVIFSQMMTVGIDSLILVAIPLFIFAGELMNLTGVTHRIVRLGAVLVGHFYGGLANVGVVANFIMSGISGSALADAAATGTVLLPEMKKRGFPPDFSAAVIASAATVGPIVPPSISFVLLGVIAQVSVAQLFLGGIVPGAVMFFAMFALTYWLCRRNDYPREPKASVPEIGNAITGGLLAILAPAFVVGSIIFGIATPTEAATIAVVYTLLLGVVVYRNVSAKQILDAAGRAAIISSIVILTVAASQVFNFAANIERMGEVLVAAMLSISENKYALLAMINVLLLILGMFMEILPIMLILAPILFPLLEGMGVSDVHFGVVMVLNLMIGMITPPIGLNLFVMSTIGGVEVLSIFRRAIPYFIVLIAVLLAITYIPVLTLYLPNLVYPPG